jgi:hypothetical protein
MEGNMQVVYQRYCGLDFHKKLMVACLLLMTPQGVHKEIRTFRTVLSDLYRLRDWLKANACEMMAMVATGVYTPPSMLPEMLTLMRTHLPGNVRMLSVSVTAGMCKPCVARFHM